jgi:hypothetical protein
VGTYPENSQETGGSIMVGNLEKKCAVQRITLKSKCAIWLIIMRRLEHFKCAEHKRLSVILYLMGTSNWYGGRCTF